MDASAVQMAVLNYRNLTQNHKDTKIVGPKFKVCAMKDTVAPSLVGGDGGISTNPAGFIITNPPYGKRIGDQAEAEANYREMAVLREHFPGWKMVVISDSAGFESHFGTKAASCRELSNGALKTYLYIFE
jgi:putative N6-adenine-specific DNA methylase